MYSSILFYADMFVLIRFLYLIFIFFFFSSRRRHTRLQGDWSSDVCSSDLHPLSRFWGHGWRPCPLPCHEVRTLPCLTSFSRSTKPLGAWGLRLQLCIGGREPRTVASSCRQGPGICASVRGELKSIVRGGCRERWVRFADCKRRGGASGVPLATSPAAHTAGGSRREGTDAGLRKDLRTTTGQRQPLDCLLPPREGDPGVGGEAARQAERARHRARRRAGSEAPDQRDGRWAVLRSPSGPRDGRGGPRSLRGRASDEWYQPPLDSSAAQGDSERPRRAPRRRPRADAYQDVARRATHSRWRRDCLQTQHRQRHARLSPCRTDAGAGGRADRLRAEGPPTAKRGQSAAMLLRGGGILGRLRAASPGGHP